MEIYLFDNKRILKSDMLNAINFIEHVFSTKDFGNQGLHVGDTKKDVLNNRMNLTKAININKNNLVSSEQVHGNSVKRVFIEDAGKGALEYGESLKNCDALITNTLNLPLFAFFADCVPIFLVDPIKKCIGIAHSGWKGTLNNIVGKTIDSFIKEFDSLPHNIIAVIGPYIKGKCYEVNSEIIELFTQAGYNKDKQIVGNNIDLGLIVQHQLRQKGLIKIELDNHCTSCDSSLFFSHRRELGITGRMAGIIMLKENR